MKYGCLLRVIAIQMVLVFVLFLRNWRPGKTGG